MSGFLRRRPRRIREFFLPFLTFVVRKLSDADGALSSFHLFFNQIDNFRDRHFLYLTSRGVEATKPLPEDEVKNTRDLKGEVESEDEAEGLTKEEVETAG